jgi:uncharacterized membrane protein
MHKGRLEAFSDGVIAILITIMAFDLKAPQAASFVALRPILPTLLSYALSFIYLGIYWNNHHHMFQVTERVNGAVLWANLHLLFWLSLIPFVTSWVGQTHFASSPMATYGLVLLMAGFAYWILVRVLLRVPGGNDLLAAAIGRDFKGKISLVIYAVAIGLSFVSQWIACGLYVLVALIWLIPDPRIERTVAEGERGK